MIDALYNHIVFNRLCYIMKKINEKENIENSEQNQYIGAKGGYLQPRIVVADSAEQKKA